MEKLYAGPSFDFAANTAIEARIPLMVWGPHGGGKTAYLHSLAARKGIGFVSLNLASIEPSDITGLPYLMDGKTYFAAPGRLPRTGRGILMLDEVNRCMAEIRAAIMALICERKVNDYTLPDGWTIAGSVNEAKDGHHVDELDPAFRSRWIHVYMVPAASPWLRWARESGVNTEVIEFIERNPASLCEKEANPRAWAYVAQVLDAIADIEVDDSGLRALLVGLIGDEMTTHFLKSRVAPERSLSARQILDAWPHAAPVIQRWSREVRLDLLNATKLSVFAELRANPQRLDNAATRGFLELFFEALPAEVRRTARASLAEIGGDARSGGER